MAFLTDRTLTTGVSTNDLIHIVITGDTSQNPAGSSYKATLGQVVSLSTSITSFTYNSNTFTIGQSDGLNSVVPQVVESALKLQEPLK